jgi:hypothetical protein
VAAIRFAFFRVRSSLKCFIWRSSLPSYYFFPRISPFKTRSARQQDEGLLRSQRHGSQHRHCSCGRHGFRVVRLWYVIGACDNDTDVGHHTDLFEDQGVMGGLLTLNSFLKYFPQIDTQNPPDGNASKASNIQGITVGGYTLGCFFGAVATIWLGNILGRKRTIIVGSSIMIIGAAIQCASFSLGQLIASRLITGFGNGMNTSTVPTWQSETSKSHRRGQMVMIEGSLIVFGVMLSYW